MTLQSILGKNYKWWYLFTHSFKSASAYRWSTMSWVFSRLFAMLITIYIWKLTIDSGSNLFKFSEIFTYYIIGGILSFHNGINYNIANSIKTGGLTTKQLRPSSVWLTTIFQDTGWQSFTILIEAGILIIIGLIGKDYLIMPSIQIGLLAILLFVLGAIIKMYINLMAGMLAFFMTDAWGFMDFIAQLNWGLSGKAIPLNPHQRNPN